METIMVKLSEYTWAFKTNLEKAFLAPKDAVILMLNDGPVARNTLVAALQEWRPVTTWTYRGSKYLPSYNYLFNASYHNVALSIRGDTYDNYRRKHPKYDRAYWYRIKHGVYALTPASSVSTKWVSDRLSLVKRVLRSENPQRFLLG
jgi:hypothetical protein